MKRTFVKGNIEERAVEIANYSTENDATVRQAARQFGISKRWEDLQGVSCF